MKNKYRTVALGGTFDRLHNGHAAFLKASFGIAESIVIGVTQPDLNAKKLFSTQIEPFEARVNGVIRYLVSEQIDMNSVRIVALNDRYGEAVTDPDIEVLVVTPDTKGAVTPMNEIRRKAGVKPLKTVLVPFVLAEDGRRISSERIRKGEIDRQGRVYARHCLSRQTIYLPTLLRGYLRQPLGHVIPGTKGENHCNQEAVGAFVRTVQPHFLVSVGDVVSLSCLASGIRPDIMIYDLRSRREALNDDDIRKLPLPNKIVINPAGALSYRSQYVLLSLIRRALETKDKEALKVRGEEDLLTLSSVLFTPLGSVVLYGQKDLGVVAISVTEDAKNKAYSLVRQFHDSLD